MFWLFSFIWTVIYVVNATFVVATANGYVRFLHFLTLPVFMIGLILIYGLTGINIINEWMRRPVLLFGKYVGTAGPGFAWVDPAFHDLLDDVPVQDVVTDVKVENAQTHDNVRVNISLALTTRVDPDKVRQIIVEVQDVESAKEQRAKSAVSEVVSQNTLDYLLGSKVEFSEKLRVALWEKVGAWGVQVKALEIRDFKIADEAIEQAIAMKARGQKEAEAELNRATMQLSIAEKLKEAAGAMDENAWRLKGMEVMLELCRSANNNTIVIPTGGLNELMGNILTPKHAA